MHFEMPKTEATIAVVIPCYQEERTIGKVVRDFRQALPRADIFVFDNNCTDRTAEYARAAGAIVWREKRQGKGYVVASMLEKVDADICVMVDGDDTYDARAVELLLAPILSGDADMTVACRLQSHEVSAFRNFHILGNRLVCGIINWMFKSEISDIFSGYRAFTREAAKLIPITAVGFDVETELTLQALYRGLVIKEVQAAYGTRPDGSHSKLQTGSDGMLVLLKLFMVIKSYKPLTFFGGLAILLMVAGLSVGFRPVFEYAFEHSVHAVPSAILASSLVILSCFSLGLGLILNSVNLRLLEVEKLIRKWDVKEMSSARSFSPAATLKPRAETGGASGPGAGSAQRKDADSGSSG
jgi:glycosyltransferase involved in cell wall biosynthesis